MELRDGKYFISGTEVLQLSHEFGTPLYVYDADKIQSQYQKLKNAFAEVDLEVKYAVKALSNVSVLKLFKSLGAGLDVVSIQEAMLGLKVGFLPSQILFTPNSVSFEEIKMGVDLGLTINIDNISILEHFGHEYGNSVPCSIRMNPHIMAGGHSHIQTGHIDSKFGISIYQLRHITRIVAANNIKIIGLHMHTGSDILDASVFIRGAELLFEAAEHFKELEFIDFGSGFKVAYKVDDVTTDIDELGKELSTRFNDFCKSYGRKLKLWFEPGKFLVSECGYLLVKVNTVKQTMATVFVGVDSGQNHLIRPMFYDAYHHIINVSNPSGVQRVYTVVGYICETDTFAECRPLPEVREDDLLVFRNAGAYCFEMASHYNSRFKPAEVLVKDGKSHLIRKRDEMEDLLKNKIEIL